jgi:hypothetical protein
MENRTKARLVPDSEVRDRYRRTGETLRAWEQDPRLNFPKPVWINGRKYRSEAELDAFDRARAAERQTEPTS